MFILSCTFFFLFCLLFLPLRTNRILLGLICAGIWLFLTMTVLHLVCDSFTGSGVTLSVLYHLRSGLAGADFASYRFLIIGGLTGLILSLGGAAACFRWKIKRNASPRMVYPTLFLLGCALLSHPLTVNLTRIIASQHQATNYRITDFQASTPPRPEKTGPPKNLVLVYLESLEHTYFDEQLFPGLINRLRGLERQGVTFTDIRQLNASWWTIGGMVASQCGIPLVTPSHGNSMSGISAFYPGAVCLGDILKENGYRLTFMGGADLDFAGKGSFLRSHGFDTVLGSRELDAAHMDPSLVCGWGIHDDKLLDLAWEKFRTLSAGSQPFVLSVLTLDTHHPNGFPSSRCRDLRYRQGENPMLNTVLCTDHLAGDFIARILASPQAKNTVVAVLSDHLAMKNAAMAQLNKKIRKNFLLIIDPELEPGISRRPGSSLDVATTLLHRLGFSGRLGLGVDLLAEPPAVSLVSRVPRPDSVLMSWRSRFLALWQFPSITRGFAIDPARHRLQAGGREYPLPVLITATGREETTYYFENYARSLLQYLLVQGPDTPFFLVDSCARMWVFGEEEKKEGFCLASGKQGGTIRVQTLAGSVETAPKWIGEILAQSTTAAQYQQNMRELFGRILGEATIRLFDQVPDGSTVYIIRGRYGKYPNLYAGMPWIRKRGIKLVRDIPTKGEFYFLSRDLEKDRPAYPGYTLQVYHPGTQLMEFLREHLRDTVIIAAKDEASQHLSPRTRSFFTALDVDLSRFGYRDSFACVIDQEKPLAWGVEHGRPVVLDDRQLRARGIDRVVSAGKTAGNRAEIIINGQDVSPNQRGLNIVVKKKTGAVIRRVFDTFHQEWTGLAVIRARK